MHIFKSATFTLAAALLLPAGAASSASRADTGLGSSWPNTADVSESPHYHVYQFERGGIRYVQVNDGEGSVRGAIGYAGGQIMDLPVGTDSSGWVVTNSADQPSGERVYRDEAISISAAPQSDGTAQLVVTPTNCEEDPLLCSHHGP